VSDLRSAGNSTRRSKESKLGARIGRPRQPSPNQDSELKAAQFRPKRALVLSVRSTGANRDNHPSLDLFSSFCWCRTSGMEVSVIFKALIFLPQKNKICKSLQISLFFTNRKENEEVKRTF